MSWTHHHRESERLASEAEVAARRGDAAASRSLYAQAAQSEVSALSLLGPDKSRTLGITAVSAASLWYHAKNIEEAARVAHYASILPGLPAFAAADLRALLQAIWIRGVLRALNLDEDWLEVSVDGKSQSVKGVGEAVDDLIGPMVNREVNVRVQRGPRNSLLFIDIEVDE
jgi:hypothetical protein